MQVYVETRNRREDYRWLPAPPQDVARYDALSEAEAHCLRASGGGFAVVLPGLPSGRMDFCHRVIENKLVAEGLTRAEAERLLAYYRVDIHSLETLVEKHLPQTQGDAPQQLEPGLERALADLLLQPPAPSPAETAPFPVKVVYHSSPSPWKRLLWVFFLLLILAAIGAAVFFHPYPRHVF